MPRRSSTDRAAARRPRLRCDRPGRSVAVTQSSYDAVARSGTVSSRSRRATRPRCSPAVVTTRNGGGGAAVREPDARASLDPRTPASRRCRRPRPARPDDEPVAVAVGFAHDVGPALGLREHVRDRGRDLARLPVAPGQEPRRELQIDAGVREHARHVQHHRSEHRPEPSDEAPVRDVAPTAAPIARPATNPATTRRRRPFPALMSHLLRAHGGGWAGDGIRFVTGMQ